MDHWGDPWADDAAADSNAHIAAPAKVAAPTFAPAPIALNAFLDDAQWGSDAWAAAPRIEERAAGNIRAEEGGWGARDGYDGREDGHGASKDVGGDEWGRVEGETEGVESGVSRIETPRIEDTLDMKVDEKTWSGRDGYDKVHKTSEEADGNGWRGIEGVEGADNGVSETSDSATTVTAKEVPARALNEGPQREEDASTRSSASLSEASHVEAGAESPRTSIEEERAAGKVAEGMQEGGPEKKEDAGVPATQLEKGEQEAEDEFGDFEDEVAQEREPAQEPSLEEIEGEMPGDARETSTKPAVGLQSGPIGNFVLDPKLLAELFPPAKDTPKLEQPPQDPIFSTSSRKAWYRLTRKQTMREYNSGGADDNYIRVTWKTSHIRTEVNKTVARWANEDRIAGRGPGAKASFFWDTTAPVDKRASLPLQPRTRSSVMVSDPVRPVSQVVEPLSTQVPAAFNWSSPSSASQAVPDSRGPRSTSSPITAKHSAIAKLQRQNGRAASLDLSPRPREAATHKRTSTTTDFSINGAPTAPRTWSISPVQAPPSYTLGSKTSSAISSPVAPIPPPTDAHVNPWASLRALDTSPAPKQVNTDFEDDDEWGEMVESPAVSIIQTPISATPAPLAETSEPTIRNNTHSTPSATPVSRNPLPLQPLPPPVAPKHASPLVRLKGTVSPTSASFKPNALVPTDSQETIGPHLLKPRDRSREAPPEKANPVPPHMSSMDEVLAQPPAPKQEETTAAAPAIPDPRAPSEPPMPTTTPSEPATPRDPSPPRPPDWASAADLSIFETSPQGPPPAPAPPPPSDPADPWSIFTSPVPAAPSPRPAPHAPQPPTKQPLPGATSSAQRRKAEEDDVVRSIVRGLPDLGYMLRR